MDFSLVFPAFIAGLLTFLAPCTLPLVPGYLSFISGASYNELKDKKLSKRIHKKVIINGFLFVIGFSLVFIAMGTLFGGVGSSLAKHRVWISRIGGVFVIFFGLYMMHILKLPFLNFLNSDHKLNIVSYLRPGKPFSSFMLGATFAFGWTPCVGPILGTILTLALTVGTVGQASFLLLIFSIGLAIPFLVISVLAGSAFYYIKKITKYLNVISVIGGVFLLILGIFMLSGNMSVWNSFIYDFFEFINYDALLEHL